MDELHDQEVRALVLAQLFDVHHVGVLDARGEQRLVQEHLAELLVVGELGMHDLDGDVAREAGRARAPRQEQRRHAALAQLGDSLVVSDSLPGAPHDLPG